MGFWGALSVNVFGALALGAAAALMSLSVLWFMAGVMTGLAIALCLIEEAYNQ